MAQTIDLMGDPHLGRVFQHGVPLARKGEREASVWSQFVRELYTTKADFHVNMGDLFDKAIVSYDTILRAATIYNDVARSKPNTKFVILKGNHDLLRDLERKSAFDLFAKLVTQGNIYPITNPQVIDRLLFVGYHPTIRSVDLLTDDFKGQADTYFGHNDITDYGNDHNVIPTRRLAELDIKTAYTGHIHKPSSFNRDGVDVTVVGSLQPYAHGEEVNDDIYVSLELSELADAGDLTNKCVRILLQPGEMLEDEINCLQITFKRIGTDDDSAPVVQMGEFNMDQLFRDAFVSAGVSEGRTTQMIEKYTERRLYADE